MLDTPNVDHDPSAANARRPNPDFLAGGGEVGERLRALNWQTHPLGESESWPQSLKTIVRMMLDSRYAMWMLWGPELTFFCNDAYLPTVGIKRDWVLGARSDKVWEEIWPDIGPRIDQVLEHGQATWDEGLLLFLERSGFPEETYHTFSYSPVYDDDNRVAGMLCVVTEVTERVIGERRLRVLRDLASPQAGVESVDAVCRHACEVLATYPFDVPFAALYRVNAAAGVARCVASTRALEGTVPATFSLTDATSPWPVAAVVATDTAQELHNLQKAGIEIATEHWPELVNEAFMLPLPPAAQQGIAGILLVGVSPRRPLDEAYRSFIGLIGSQVSSALARAQAYEAERRRAEALAELDRAKTAFFSNVSHEFRTPLTLMLGPLETALADRRIPQEHHQNLELAHRNAERLRKLVNSLLDFSRIEAGRVQASYEPTDLATLTRDLASTFRSAMEKAELELTVDCAPLDEPVFVDREMWEKIVLNLLSNAFKFTLQGGVTVRVARDSAHALLEIADTGVGVPADELPRLFQRFYRVEGAHGRTHEGSGIGLALVQELIKQHGGTIAASSVLGQGTKFAVRIPFGTTHLPTDQIKTRQGPSSSTAIGAQAFVQEALRWLPNTQVDATTTLATLAATSTDSKDSRFVATFGARIVLADDNSDMRGYMRELLAPYYDVEELADGEQALSAARRARPDLILSDVMMPRLDGFGLLAAVRADEALRSVPVVLLSARAGEEARIEGLDAGADDYLIKPFSARELLARVGALLELTQMRRAAEEAFRLRTAQFETLLMEAPLGVYLVDADFRIREANPIAREVFGNPPDLIGSDFDVTIHKLWPQQFADELVRLFRHTLATGESYFTPERIERRADSGIVEYYEWQISRIPLPDARFGVVCYFRDIAAHVLARTRLETADRQKDEFLSMLAHELRNPLAPIRSAAEILARTAPAEAYAHSAVSVVQRQVGILVRLVDDLLDVSRITQGRIELRRKPINLADAIAQAVETVDPLIKERRHRLSVTSHDRLRVNGDPARLVQCIANVLTNAAKYTDTGGEIRIESHAVGGNAVLSVTDNGVGISAELLPHLFELFVQSARTLDRSQGGLGIGLSVVKRLIEMHGGNVTAASDGPGRGATFEIRLPLAAAQEQAVEDARREAPPKRRVLVVDDNADAANTLAMLLNLDGHEVRAVYSARTALKAVQGFEPDVVLLDIGLPEMDGYEVARRIREEPMFTGLRLVALTGYGQAEDKQRTRAAGFDDHLVKPVEMRALQEALARAAT